METAVIGGEEYRRLIKNAAAYLNRNRTEINNLNVFPVPDGDTGDNMYLTISSGIKAAENISGNAIGLMAEGIAKGMLMGARGNSGVILSRIFSGLAKGLQGKEEVQPTEFADALQRSVEEAYSSVSKPVEGTILTVLKDSVNRILQKKSEIHSFEALFEIGYSEAEQSLERTPELLPVLKEAHVVDSGGAGLCCIFKGMEKALKGETIADEEKISGSEQNAEINLDEFTEETDLSFGYCTEFLLRLQPKKKGKKEFYLDDFQRYLNENGDSVVAFQEGTVVKVHVHTKSPGQILNYAQQYGEFLTLKIENMNLQHNENQPANGFTEKKKRPFKKYGLVTVATGEGIEKVFSDIGVDIVIPGGQSMNPPAESFVEAFRELNCDSIFVFPNNSNILLTARQAAELYPEKPVYVVKTRNVGEGYAALSMMDTTQDAETILKATEEVLGSVRTGMVAKANRNTQIDQVNVKEGDYIGFTEEEIVIDEKDRAVIVRELAEKICEDAGVLLVIRGNEATKEEAENLCKELENRYEDTEVILIDGLQPIYDYILVAE